jgi:hypothetical protein
MWQGLRSNWGAERATFSDCRQIPLKWCSVLSCNRLLADTEVKTRRAGCGASAQFKIAFTEVHMSSSINGFSNASFRLLTQQFSRGLQERAANREGVRENTGSNGGTSTGVNERNLGRAERDFALTMRGVERETVRATDLLGNNAEGAEKVKSLAKEFGESMTARYETFVNGGGRDYMTFAEETAAARRDFRAQLRDLTRGIEEPSTRPATTPTPTRGQDVVEIDRTEREGRTERGERGERGGRRDPVERAERDVNAIMRGLDRQTKRFERRLGDNAEAMDKYTTMRDTFAASVQKEFETFKSEGGNYMDFVERVAQMRQSFRSEVRSTFGDLLRGRGNGPRGGESAGEPTTQPIETATTGDLAKPSESALDAGGSLDEAPVSRTEPTVPPMVNQANLDRAKRDVEVLMSWLDRSAGKLMEAFGDTEKGKQVEESAAAFREMVEEKFKAFTESGGSGSYLDFIGGIASARMELGRRFDSMAGSGFDGIG